MTGFLYGRGDEIRTHDLFVPNEALYQAEPHPEVLYYASTLLLKKL